MAPNPKINTNSNITIFVKLNNWESSFTWLELELTSVIFDWLSELSDESEVPLLLPELEELELDGLELEELELEELELDELELEEPEPLSEDGAELGLELDEGTSVGYSVPWPGCAKTTLKQEKINIIVIKIAKYL